MDLSCSQYGTRGPLTRHWEITCYIRKNLTPYQVEKKCLYKGLEYEISNPRKEGNIL
jgi:hypothetical protein